MFVRHQNLRRSSLVKKINLFRKLELNDDERDEDTGDELKLEEEVWDTVQANEVVTIIVSQTVFKTYASTLLNLPKTRLAKMFAEFHKQHKQKDSRPLLRMRFERDPKMFYHILDAYERKRVHVPREICIRQFKKEMEFWKLKNSLVAPCCRDTFMEAFEDLYQQDMLEEHLSKISLDVMSFIQEGTCRDRIWEFLDNYRSSKKAKWFSWLCNIMIIISVAVNFFSTHPRYRVLLPEYTVASKNHNRSSTNLSSNALTEMLLRSQPYLSIIGIELTCAVFFTILLMLNIMSSPCKKIFFLSVQFWCDFLYLISVWALYGTFFIDKTFWVKPERVQVFQAIQIVSIFRFIRLYMLERSYQPFRILKLAALSSLREIGMLFLFIILAVVLYGSFLYCSELMATETFGNTFTGMWCVIITMLTVGYGDAAPTTELGQIFAAFCALTGIVLVGMPLPIIANCFYGYYEYVYFSCHKAHNTNKPLSRKVFPSP